MTESPEPAWFRLFSRVERTLKRESVEDMCHVLESVQKELGKEIIDAILTRKFRDVDRLSDEFYEMSYLSPMCPKIALAKKAEEIQKVMKVMVEIGE